MRQEVPAATDGRDVRVWALVLVYLAFGAAAFLTTGFSVSPANLVAMGGMSGVAAVVAVLAILRMPDRWYVRGFNTLTQHSVVGLGSAMLVCAAASLERPLADATMLSIDWALGYDWQFYIGTVTAHPALARTLSFAYDSLFWQMGAIVLYASLYDRRLLLQRFVACNVFVLCLTIAIFAMLPVTTAWVHLGIDADGLRALHLREGGWPQQLLDIRRGLVREVGPGSNFSLIGFPSYHCSAGLMNAWMAWRCGRLRWPMIGIVAVMIASTPVNGGHYVVDIAGAVLVTLVAIRLAGVFVGTAPPAEWRRYTAPALA